jgi:phosphoribosyl 1,2-cyclic phosphodiesterase
MIRYAVFGSGSDANAYLFNYQGVSIMVDNGFTLKELGKRAGELRIDLCEVQALFLSHTHADHVKGVGPFARSYNVPVYHHREVDLSAYQRKRKSIEGILVSPGSSYQVGPFSVMPFATHHDCDHSINFLITAGSRHMLIITDTGYLCDYMTGLIPQADLLFLEANYEPSMLMEGPYPYHLKRRIASNEGHLSNDAAIDALNNLPPAHRLSQVYLCHLSAVNNSVEVLTGRLRMELASSIPVCVCARGQTASGSIPSL